MLYRSASVISLLRILCLGCWVSLVLLCAPALGQNRLDLHLQRQGQTRLDSLEFFYRTQWEEKDSTTAFAGISTVRKYASRTNDKVLTVFVDYLSGLYYLNGKQGARKKGLATLSKGFSDLAKLPQSPLTEYLKANIKHWWGLGLFLIRDYSERGINHLLEADLIYRKIGYENVLFADYKLTNLGLYYLDRINDSETAYRYFKEAEQYVKQEPIDWYRIHLYRMMAKCLVKKKQYAEAIRYNQLGIAQVRTRKDSVRIGSLSGNIGEIILNYYPNPIEAEPYFQKELMYRLRFNPKKGYDDIAKVYGNLCQIAGLRRNGELVKQYYDKAMATLKLHPNEIDRYYAERSIYKNRMIADTLVGDYKNALRHEMLYREAMSKIQREDLQKTTAEASVKFEAENLKLQAELARQQVQNSRFWIIIVSLLLIVATIGAYLIYNFQRSKRATLSQQLLFEQKEAERLAELDSLKTRFFTNISHEFRTPLTLLVGPLSDFRKKYPAEVLVPMMQRNVERLQNLINQLLDLSKLEAGKLQVQIQQGDIAFFVKNLLVSFDSLAESRQVQYTYNKNYSPQIAYFDADKLEKILTNLLSNAFKFTPPAGQIHVETSYDANALHLLVRDSGIGIRPENLSKIFDRFYQVENESQSNDYLHNYEGTGIGLALVKELVNVMKGKIEVESEVGKGTTFSVSIPTDIATWEKLLVSSTSVPKPSHQGATPDLEPAQPGPVAATPEAPILLVVEDNTDLRRYVRMQFEGQYQVVEAVDGQQGLEMALEIVPDAVVCDLMMPRLDGFGFCKALKTDLRTSHIPVVMLTAKASLQNRLEGLELGADDYLAKPFNTDELQIRVRNLILNREKIRHRYIDLPLKAQTDPAPPSLDERFLQQLRAVIEEHLGDNAFDVESLATPLNISPIQVRRKLKALTGQTAIEFIRNYRLERAATMLRNQEGNVSEVAYRVGFESLPYFSKVFQEKFNKKPSEW